MEQYILNVPMWVRVGTYYSGNKRTVFYRYTPTYNQLFDWNIVWNTLDIVEKYTKQFAKLN